MDDAWRLSPDDEPSDHDPIAVYLLDDHEVVRRGVRDLLETELDIQVIGESGLAQDAARRIPALRPDVAILDARLPDGSGIEVCRQVRSVDPGIAVLILTSYDEDEALFAAIMAGASGYVLKQIKGADLLETVRRVAAGQSMLDPAVTAQVLRRLREGPPEDQVTKHLTPKEHQILDLVGEGLTNRQIAERLGLAEKTVKNYVSTMLGKLGVESRTQAAIIAVRQRRDRNGSVCQVDDPTAIGAAAARKRRSLGPASSGAAGPRTARRRPARQVPVTPDGGTKVSDRGCRTG